MAVVWAPLIRCCWYFSKETVPYVFLWVALQAQYCPILSQCFGVRSEAQSLGLFLGDLPRVS